MKSVQINKTVPSINQDASDVLLSEIRQTVQVIKVILNLYQATADAEFRRSMLVRLSKELKKPLQLYKDKEIALQILQEELGGPFSEEPQKKIIVKKIITHLLIDLEILLNTIIQKDDEAFKALLVMGDRKSFQGIQFKRTVRIVGNNQRFYQFYSLLSYTACYGTLDMVSVLKQGGYLLFPLDSSYVEPITNPITVMIHQVLLDEAEIIKRCRTLLVEMSVYNRTKCLKVLTQGDAYTNQYLPLPLYSALLKKYYDLARFLLKGGADAGQSLCHASDKQPYCPIELIVREDRVDLLRCIPNDALQVFMKKDLSGQTVFQWAIIDRSTACISYLLRTGMLTNIDAEVGEQQYTALMAAAYRKDTKLVRALLQKGADFAKISLAGYTALSFAVQEDSYDVTELLLSYMTADRNQLSSLGLKTTLLNLAVVRKCYRIMELLIKKGALPDEPDLHGNTPVGLAMANSDSAAMEILVNAGVNLYEHRSQLSSLAEHEHSVSLLSIAEYAFFFNHEFLRYLCKIGKFDLKQKCEGKRCFYDYLSMDNIQLVKYLDGKEQEFTFDPAQVIDIFLSVMPKISHSNLPVHASPAVSTLKLVGHEVLQAKQLHKPRVTTAQGHVAETAVFIAEAHQEEENIQKRIQAKNKELTKARKLKRSRQPASRSVSSSLKKKTEHKQHKSQICCDTLPVVSSSGASFTTAAVTRPLTSSWDLEGTSVIDAYSPLVCLAMYPLEKKDLWVSEKLPKLMKTSSRSKRNKPLEVADNAPHLLKFHRVLPPQIAESEALLVRSHSRVVDTIACLYAVAALDHQYTELSARLVSLTTLKHIFILANFYYNLEKRCRLSVDLTDIIALRDVLAHAYYLPSEKDILNAVRAFNEELPSGDCALDVLALATLFQKTIGLPLLLFYRQKQDSMNGQDLLVCHSVIHHAFHMLEERYQQGEAFYFSGLDSAFDTLFITAYSLRKALNLTSKQDNFFRLWRNLLAHDVPSACGKTFQTIICLDILLNELNQHLFADDLLLPQIKSLAVSVDSVLEQQDTSLDEDHQPGVMDGSQPGHLLWQGSSRNSLLFRSAHTENPHTECDQAALCRATRY